jgi:hypothetical protein
MAMTKAEKTRLEELETALALSWPAYPEPKPMTREEIEAAKVTVKPESNARGYGRTRIALGWFCNAYNGEVSQGWSDGMYHSRHNITGDSASQNIGRMYRTKQEAAMALRHEMSREFAKKLVAVDRIVTG